MIFTFFRFIKGLVWSWTSNKISTSDPWHKKQEWELTSQIKEKCLFLSIKDWVLHQDMPCLLEWGRFHLLSICGSSWIELAIKSITIRSNLKEKKIFFKMIYLKVFSYFLANNSSVPPTSSSALYLFSFLFVCFLVFPLLLLLLSHCRQPWIFGCCNQMMFLIKLPLTNRNARDKSGQSDIMESFFPLRIDRHIECLYFSFKVVLKRSDPFRNNSCMKNSAPESMNLFKDTMKADYSTAVCVTEYLNFFYFVCRFIWVWFCYFAM